MNETGARESKAHEVWKLLFWRIKTVQSLLNAYFPTSRTWYWWWLCLRILNGFFFLFSQKQNAECNAFSFIFVVVFNFNHFLLWLWRCAEYEGFFLARFLFISICKFECWRHYACVCWKICMYFSLLFRRMGDFVLNHGSTSRLIQLNTVSFVSFDSRQ